MAKPNLPGGRGYNGVDRAKEKTKKMYQGKVPKRFWLYKPDDDRGSNEGYIIFLDDNPYVLWEHLPKVNGRLTDPYPCLQGVWDNEACAFCQNKDDPYYVGWYTVIDCREFEYQGKTYKNIRRLFPAKLETIEKLKLKRRVIAEKNESTPEGQEKPYKLPGLLGKRVLAARTGKRSANVGDSFEIMGEMPMIRLNENDQNSPLVLADREFWFTNREGALKPPLPYNYEEIVEKLTLTNARARDVLRGSSPGGDPWENDPNSSSHRGNQQTAPPSGQVAGDGSQDNVPY